MPRFLLAVCASLVVCGVTLAATVIAPTDFKEVVSLSTVIVRGHVTDTRGVMTPAGGVDTVVTVAVDSLIKGQTDGFVSLRLPGGEVGNTRMMVVGGPTMRVGQQAVLFLKPGPDNVLRPVALTLGIYPVQSDPQTGRSVIAPPVVQGQTTSGREIVRGDVRRKLMTVSEFESLVKLVMSAPRAIPRTTTATGRGGRP